MSRRYWLAIVTPAMGVAAVGWGFVAPNDAAVLGLLVGAAAMPMAVLFMMSARTAIGAHVGTLLAGATLAPLVALIGQALVFTFAYFFFLGFAEAGIAALETLRIDPALVDVAGSPWTLLLFFEVVLFAPFIEELGKGIASSIGRPATRGGALMAGVTAGVGFAMIENLLFAVAVAIFGGPWAAILIVRALGAAIHPLASGIVAVGWWEWRTQRDAALLAKRYVAGVGIHALWNGSIVVLGIVGEAYGMGEILGVGFLAVVYAAGLGVIATWAIWRVAGLVRAEHTSLAPFAGTDASAVGAWLVLSSSLLVPVGLLFLAYPDFVGG